MKKQIKSLYKFSEQECHAWNVPYKKPQLYMNSAAAIALCENGSIIVIHNPMNYDFSGWDSVIKVSCGKNHMVGLRSDGTVLAAGDNSAGQCDVSAWRDVADIAAYGNMTVGLSKSGEAYITGRTISPQTAAVCSMETSDKNKQDTDIQTNVSGTIGDSWEQIIANIKNGTYADKYRIGDTKILDLGSEGIIEMQIVDFNADKLAESDKMAAITWISKQLLNYYKSMCFLRSFDRWENSDLRSYLKEAVMPLIPEVVRSEIKPVMKYMSIYDGLSIQIAVSTENVWIPSYKEICSTGIEKVVPCPTYYYYKTLQNNESLIKHRTDGSTSWWWLRSAYFGSSCYGVYTDGSIRNYNASNPGGVALGFCT